MVTYKKPAGCSEYIDKEKFLATERLHSETSYKVSEKPENAIRETRLYSGRDVLKLPHDFLTYDEKGLPLNNNNFDLNEFEIFNK